MPTFDELLGAVRDDCDTMHLAGSAELRQAGQRRTNLHRTIGGAAVLVVVGGLTTGAAMYGHGATQTPTSTTPGSAASTVTTTVPPSPSPSLCYATDGSIAYVTVSGDCMVTAHPTGPVSPPPPAGHPTSHPSTSSPADTSPAACSVANFDVAHAQVNVDDASGLRGFDIVIKYRGANSCKISQGTTVTYVDSSGHRVAIPLSQTAAPFMVKPHTSISTSVFGPTDAAVNPPPAACSQPHVYAHLDVRIDGQAASLGATTISLPCGDAKALPWSAA